MAFRPGGSGCAVSWRAMRCRAVGALSLITLLAALTRADAPAESGQDAMRDAHQAIPWRLLSSASREQVNQVVGDATLYRQLPTRVIDCDDQMFAYLVDHPELIVDAWNVMGVSRLRLKPLGPGRYQVSDSAGAEGTLSVLHRSGGGSRPLLMVMRADGEYQAPPMPKPIRGQSVLLLRASALEEQNGRCFVTVRLDSFIHFSGPATKLVAKTFKPLIFRTADHNFIETMRFVSLFSRTAETDPHGMGRLASHLRGVDPATRDEFTRLCLATSNRYVERRRLRDLRSAGRPVSAAR